MVKKYLVDLFCQASPEDYWPRRLLHLPSMTSVERIDSDIYPLGPSNAVAKQPLYSVLSYTWGRYEKRSRKPEYNRLKVHGIDWDIPPIQESHFTVEGFESVIEVLRQRHDFAWIDVACIHQEDNRLRVEEIGQQGKIFQRAESAFIWLCRTSEASLRWISESVQSLQNAYLEDVQEDFFRYPMPVQFDSAAGDGISEHHFVQLLDTASTAITELAQDTYFSSLWTLQESLYNQTAFVISSNAAFTTLHPLSILTNRLPPIQDSTQILAKVEAIHKLVSRIGYDPTAVRIHNPHQSRAAARHRTASLEQDRVFATMSIYGVVIRDIQGTLQTDPYSFSLAELEHAFAATLNHISPSLGQFFVHSTRPDPGETWKVTAQTKIVDDNQFWTTDWRRWKPECCILATEEGHAIFEGQTCSLSALLTAATNKEFHLMIDEYLLSEHRQLGEVAATGGDASLEEFSLNMGRALIAVFERFEIIVLKLTVKMGLSQCVVLREIECSGRKYERVGISHTWPLPELKWRNLMGELH